ncbi:head decoration protein [Streptomyces sp. SHP22-7]|nr:head decoration protein [Streptomyces sp. SHP22-7]RIH58769.1 head decoration protein [Streptomyces sp. SHP22-7]RIH59124.1 head decoration protein [Streptomyces sp. SHP22-7]
MDLQPTRTETTVTADRRWLLSTFGTETNKTITLDLSQFAAGTNYTAAANGLPNVIPSGTPLGKVTANGLYGPYDSAATDGTQTFAGLLEFDVAFNTGSARVGAALRIVGDIDVSQLPVAFTVPAAANRTDHLVFSDLS